jgi:hypothetical protein
LVCAINGSEQTKVRHVRTPRHWRVRVVVAPKFNVVKRLKLHMRFNGVAETGAALAGCIA